MSRMKWNLDLLEEVKKQHDEALISTEHVVNRVRSDLFSMTEEVWEGEDADIARDQLHELSFKEMPDTYDQIDTCNNVIQKAQKEAYESKNFCNDFPQIFSSGSMPSDGNQSRCTGDLMRDEDSCEGLKSSMKAAGENARNVHSAISSVESILASLETDFAKFDYSSYTQPIKEQTQKVAERTEMYNTAVTRYEQKTKELDHTLSNGLKLATPDFVPAPLDPSCLGIGEELHFGDSKITGSLEEYITAKIDGELDEAQIKDILSMLFDKENVDISEYSEEDFGMAFIKLSEEKKRAMLMEMGYSKEQIDSILDSCKGNKAVAVGNSIGRTLIEKIADKDGNKHGRLGKTGKASTLGLAGIKRPGQFNTDFAKTNAVAADATTAGSGSSSKDKQKPKQRQKNNSNNTASNSGSNGNNTPTSSSDPYAEYKTGNPAVDEKIDEILTELEEDPYKYTAEGTEWNEFDDDTKRALAAIYGHCMDKIGESFDESECETERRIAGEILHTTTNRSKQNYPYAFKTVEIDDLMARLDPNSFGYEMASQLRNAKIDANDNLADSSYLEIGLHNAGISFGYKSWTDSDNISEFYLFTNRDRTIRYIEKCEEDKPGCFDHTRSMMSEEEIISLYNSAETSADEELIDRLMKADSTYEDVFIGDAENISNKGALALGTYGYKLLWLAKEKGGAFETYYNNYLSQLVTYHDEEDSSRHKIMKYNNYIEKYNIGCTMVSDAYLVIAWATQESEYDKEFVRMLENAKENEMISFALYSYALSVENTVGADIKVNYYRPDSDTDKDEVNPIFNYPRVDSLSITDLYYPQLISLKPEMAKEAKTVQLNSCNASHETDIKNWDELQDLKEKQKKALMDIGIDLAIDVIGTFWKPVGLGLSILDMLLTSDPSNAVSQAGDLAGDGKIGKIIGTGTSLYDAVLAYMNSYDTFQKAKEECDKEAYSSAFYTSHYCDVLAGGVDYYTRMDDLGIIRMIQNWSKNGLGAVYQADEMEFFNEKKDDIKENINEALSGYDQSVIDKAWNTIFEGYSNNDDTYDSILDIPEEVFRVCIEQINDERKNVDIADVQSTIETYGTFYVNPN